MKNLRAFLVSAALALTVATGCSKQEPAPSKPAGESPAATDSGAPGSPASPAAPAATASKHPAMLDPSLAVDKAPEVYKAKFTTTKGDFVVEVTRAWAPQGADRFYNLVKIGYYDDTRFFRVVENFMVQFGIHGDSAVNAKWKNARIPDDAVKESNKRAFMTFATSGADSRTVQVFINFVDANARLDAMGFSPFGKIIEGMNVVDSLYKGYGEGAPGGQGPNQARIQTEGNAYLDKDFPKMDRVVQARILP